MATGNSNILSVTLSELSSFSDVETLDTNALFHVECKQSDNPSEEDQKTPTGFQSSKMTYAKFLQILKNEFSLAKINADLQTMEGSLEVPSTLVVMENSSPSRRFVLSAISENTRASINGVSCYNMTEAIKNILNEITISRLSAIESPWLFLSSVVNETGNSTTKAATQSLVNQLSDSCSAYLRRSNIKNNINNQLTTNGVTQKVLWDIYNNVMDNFILSNKITNSLGGSNQYVASTSLVSNISSAISSSVHKKQLATVSGNSETSAAAVSLVNSLSNTISSNFIKNEDVQDYLRKSRVVSFAGDDTQMATSQSFVTDISNDLSTTINKIFAKPSPSKLGDLYYLTPDGNGKSQSLLFEDAFVCEDTTDIAETKEMGVNFQNIFNQWNRGGLYNNSQYYETNPDAYPKPLRRDQTNTYLQSLSSIYGITSDIFTCNNDQLNQALRTTRPYTEVKSNYEELNASETGYKFRVVRQVIYSPVSHVMSTENQLSLFDSRDISTVLSVWYPDTPGTCIYNLSAPDGVLYNSVYLKKQTISDVLKNYKISAILSAEINSTKYIECNPDYALPIHTDDKGVQFWFYNTQVSSIVQPLNTSDYTYFYSNVNYNNYDIIVRVYALSGDDDCVGIVAAYARDSNNNPIILSFSRTPNKENPLMPCRHWFSHYGDPFIQSMENMISSGHIGAYLSSLPAYNPNDNVWKLFANLSAQTTPTGVYVRSYLSGLSDSQSVVPESCGGGQWTYEHGGAWGDRVNNGGVLIRVKRRGDCISAWTTEFGQEPDIGNLGHMITVDLNTTGKSPWGANLDDLSYFKGPKPIGFSMISQPATLYELKKFDIPMTIINTGHNPPEVSVYNIDSNIWEKQSVNPYTYAGIGRLTRNPYTNKLFYVSDNDFVKLYQPPTSQ